MKTQSNLFWHLAALLAAFSVPAHATVAIVSMQSSAASPQAIGTTITWSVKATDSNPGPLTFQFNVAAPGGSVFVLARDFNLGTPGSGNWTSPPFAWTPTSVEGHYQIQVVVKDFTSGETTSHTANFQVTPLVSGSTPVAIPTANPLVALFSAPSCASGSNMRIVFQEQSLSKPATTTNTLSCHPPTSMNFEIAGMYPSTAYNMYSQTITGGVAVNGLTLSFTTGALPSNIPFPPFKTILKPASQSDSAASVLLLSPINFGSGTTYPSVASNLAGNILWYYWPDSVDHFALLTRPLPGGTFLTIPNVPAWNPASAYGQVLSEIDLAGNVIRQTNTGVIQQELLAMGVTDAAPCSNFPNPQVGNACLGYFHHDAIQTLPNGQVAVIADIEKIFPPGTQGDTSGLPVDIIGDIIIVLNSNWQVVWYFDAFENDSGNGELDINRPAVLGETCATGETQCETMFLLGPGIAPLALDWLHANCIYYDPQDGSLIWSLRSQDWLVKIDYNNGSGATGNIVWLMGPDGDFSFNNIYNDPWPWFSHQHDPGIQGNGLGALTLFDNGNTRVAPPPLGLGSGDSRGMALTVNVTPGLPCAPSMPPCGQVSPVLSVDLGAFSQAMGSADVLSDGNYFFLAPFRPYSQTVEGSSSIEIFPTPGTDTGTQVWNASGTQSYRGWRMANLYQAPTI
ncbi:MAG TPA: aryl-sulfate sulfotransferase [Bryobacteraceae bacterium]|nr:aryl-sulfate sulfotransferase [Bryobacteraceae bacterium]